MAALDRNEKITLLVMLTCIVSGGLFWVGRAYRNQNIPEWRTGTPTQPRTATNRSKRPEIERLAWSRDGSQVWAQNGDGVTFCFDSNGQLKSKLKDTAFWEVGKDGRLFFSDRQKIYEWDKGQRTLRSDLKLPSSNIANNNSEERNTRIDWVSQTVLGSDARGPVHLWPMESGAPPITLSAPKFEKDVFSIPYDFAVSPDRNRAVVVYSQGKMDNNTWPSSWSETSFDPMGGRAHVLLFDLKTGQSKDVGWMYGESTSPPQMKFGHAAAQFSASGRFFIVRYQGLEIYESATGKKHASALLPENTLLFFDQGSQIAFSPDEKMLAALTNTSPTSNTHMGWIQIWSVDSGKRLQTFHCKNYPNTLRWSPNSQKLAVGGLGGEVTLWDVTPFAPAKAHQ